MAGVVRDGKVRLEKPKVSLYVRLVIDPNDAATQDDKFQLSSTDGGSYQQTKTVRDDLVKGDGQGRLRRRSHGRGGEFGRGVRR